MGRKKRYKSIIMNNNIEIQNKLKKSLETINDIMKLNNKINNDLIESCSFLNNSVVNKKYSDNYNMISKKLEEVLKIANQLNM